MGVPLAITKKLLCLARSISAPAGQRPPTHPRVSLEPGGDLWLNLGKVYLIK